MKEISLTKGQKTYVDDADFAWLSQWRWHAEMRYDGRFIAVTKINGKKIRMHRMIMACPKGMQVDHINHDTLFNLRSNLRNCTQQQNNWNRAVSPNRRFKGVQIDSDEFRTKPFRARIRVGNKRLSSASCETAEEAARAYDELARQHHGEFACLNFPV